MGEVKKMWKCVALSGSQSRGIEMLILELAIVMQNIRQ